MAIKTQPQVGSAILLAGGESRRMTFDKQRIILDNDQYLAHQLCHQLGEIFEEVIVVTKTPAFYQDLPVIVCQDHYKKAGPLAGIHAGLLASSSDYAYVIACDMPKIDRIYIEQLTDLLSTGSQGIVTRNHAGFLNPFHAYYHVDLISSLEEALQNKQYKISDFISHQNIQIISLDDLKHQNDLFTNLNTQEEIQTFMRQKGGS